MDRTGGGNERAGKSVEKKKHKRGRRRCGKDGQ